MGACPINTPATTLSVQNIADILRLRGREAPPRREFKLYFWLFAKFTVLSLTFNAQAGHIPLAHKTLNNKSSEYCTLFPIF